MTRSALIRRLRTIGSNVFLVVLVLAPGIAYVGALALAAGEWGLGVGALLFAAVGFVFSVAWFWCINNGFPTQFSLRTLLIATTLIAVVLGMVAWSSS